MSESETPTWIACLTPPGQSALATLGLYGPRAWEALRKLFRRRSGSELPQAPECGRFWLGRIGGEVADEVVVAVKQIEPLPLLEVHGHGGREVVRFLIGCSASRVCSCVVGRISYGKRAPMRSSQKRRLRGSRSDAAHRGHSPRSTARDARPSTEAIEQSLKHGEPAAAAEGLARLALFYRGPALDAAVAWSSPVRRMSARAVSLTPWPAINAVSSQRRRARRAMS